MAMVTSFRSGGATGIALSKVFGVLGLIISLAELFVSSALSMALKCARHMSTELLMSVTRLPSWSLQKEAAVFQPSHIRLIF